MKKQFIVLFTSLVLVLLFFVFAFPSRAASGFVLYSGNPLFSGYAPFVMVEEGLFKMWYSDNNGQIKYATSVDGYTWSQYADNPVLVANTNDLEEIYVSGPTVIHDGNIYKMWYTASPSSSSIPYSIRYATSPDGMTWTKFGAVNLPIQSWEGGSHAEPSVIKTGNGYQMWYTTNSGHWNISYATSTDGINWLPDNNNPVITATESWEGGEAGHPSVLYDGLKYEMYYGAGTTVNYAVSNNGTNWDKPANINPLLPSFVNWGPGAPSVLKSQDGYIFIYFMYYSSTWQIGLATAPPIITTVTVASPTATEADTSVILSATITSTTQTVNTGIVVFTIKQGNEVLTTLPAAEVTSGLANANLTLGNLAVGTYTVQADYTDNTNQFGNSSNTGTLTITNIAPTITSVTVPTDPLQVNTSVNISADFYDPGSQLESYTSTVEWGDTTSSAGMVTGTTLSAAHQYSQAGVYVVTVKVEDSNGLSGQVSAPQYLVIYDPAAGYVTGAGTITSPVGAYTQMPALSGKAILGFVSRYQNGATVPTGSTQFKFQMADGFTFKSTDYDWLVVGGARAQYKGSGKVNGSGDFAFLLTAIDGQMAGGGGEDKFRIKITDKGTGDIIYDNQLGASDTANPTTLLDSGSVVIHN